MAHWGILGDNGMGGQDVPVARGGEPSSDSIRVVRISHFLWHGS